MHIRRAGMAVSVTKVRCSRDRRSDRLKRRRIQVVMLLSGVA
jgi:hypothetical protein